MRQRLLHTAVVLLFIYAAIFVGMVEDLFMMELLHQVGMALIFAAWVFSLWRRKQGWPITTLDGPIWALFGIWILSAFLSRDPRVSLEHTWKYLVLTLTFYLFVDLMRQGQQRWVMEAVLLTGAVVVVFSALEMVAWYFGWPLAPSFLQSWPSQFGYTLPPKIHEVFALLYNPNIIGAYCVILVPIAFYWAISARQRDLRWGGMLLTVGIILTLLLTQSRGAILALVVEIAAGILLALTRAYTRDQIPERFRALLRPRALASAGVASAIILTGGVTYTTLIAGSDSGRIDLWKSAVAIFVDHPIQGVGPSQYGPTRYWYSNTEDYSPRLNAITHAHNIVLQTLAEGGILALAGGIWLIIRLGRTWWQQDQNAYGRIQIRLDGALIMLVGFGIHNMVDEFIRFRPMILVLAVAAYVATQPNKSQPTRRRILTERRQTILAAVLLLMFQIAYVPIHQGAYANAQAITSLEKDQPVAALESIQKAQDADPWLDLYKLQEAYILGVLANQQPTIYLDAAIEAHTKALELNPAWDLGWHNLAAIEAQGGDFNKAIAHEKEAINWYYIQPAYHLKLGEYYEAAEHLHESQDAYFEALYLLPSLASSGYWQTPTRQEVLNAAVTYHMVENPDIALSIAMYAGEFRQAQEIAKNLPDEEMSTVLEKKLAATVTDDGSPPCVSCYFVPDHLDLIEAELRIRTKDVTPQDAKFIEDAARRALFVSGTRWSYYLLARLAFIQQEDSDTINGYLLTSVPSAWRPQSAIPGVFYDSPGYLKTLPQAQSPTQSYRTFQPWIDLMHRLTHEGRIDKATAVYSEMLQREPYGFPVHQIGQ